MTIINTNRQDIPLIQGIAAATWPAAYAAILSGAQINYMLDRFYSTEALEAQMAAGHLFLLAVKNGHPMGFAGYELAHLPGTARLHKLYVLPDLQGSGTGGKLLDAVVAAARSAVQERVILNVNRHNPALGFYKKAGFSVFGEEDIDIGSGYFMNDYVMEKVLAADNA